MSRPKPRLVIIDDDASVCRALKRLGHACGMEVETFTSGQEFIDRLAAMPSFSIDCVVLDLQMPGLNGLEVQERLIRGGRRLPIVFITAHDEDGARERVLTAGAVAFLRKPINDELFLETIALALRPGNEPRRAAG
jgi:FixJ family two-component response regulator